MNEITGLSLKLRRYSQHDENTARHFRVLRLEAMAQLQLTAVSTLSPLRLPISTTEKSSRYAGALKIGTNNPVENNHATRKGNASITNDTYAEAFEKNNTIRKPYDAYSQLQAIELYMIGSNDCEVFIYWRRDTRSTSNKAWSNDKHIAMLLENGVQLSPSAVTADNQCAVDIGIFAHNIVESSLQVTELMDFSGAAVAKWLTCLPPSKANRVQSPAGTPRIFVCGNRAGRCHWSAGFLRDLPTVSPAPPFRCCSILTSITLIGSQDLAVKSRPNLFAHCNVVTRGKLLYVTCWNCVRAESSACKAHAASPVTRVIFLLFDLCARGAASWLLYRLVHGDTCVPAGLVDQFNPPPPTIPHARPILPTPAHFPTLFPGRAAAVHCEAAASLPRSDWSPPLNDCQLPNSRTIASAAINARTQRDPDNAFRVRFPQVALLTKDKVDILSMTPLLIHPPLIELPKTHGQHNEDFVYRANNATATQLPFDPALVLRRSCIYITLIPKWRRGPIFSATCKCVLGIIAMGRTGFDFQRGRFRILACENRAERYRWLDLPFPPPLHSGAAPHALCFTIIGSQDLDVKSHQNCCF
ncbi:hypothetical protein PR048_011595, partial [Dryococelus australis]